TWVNGKLYLTCYLEPYDGEYDHIEWSSSDESVAYMSNDGELTARGEGSCVITVTVYVNNTTTVSDTVRFYVLDE
ncbi:MAG: Ig-like domain-containing protein, partial [Bacteroidales bacterium]|nr:Ig-like domain-containing protein [Bacteroidales bacterium]